MTEIQPNIPPHLADDEFLKRGESVSPECFLHSLREKRRQHWQSARNNQDNAIQRMSEMYSDAGHFVYELLQNAEDARARTVSFRLADDALTVAHDGTLFSREDIMSITAAGASAKNELNTIGKFGVGFKSVFAVCDRPEIYSGAFCFAIENYIIPQPLSSLAAYTEGGKTVIRMPLKKGGGDGLWQKVKRTLDGLGASALLFLQNIRRLEWQFGKGDEKHCCSKSGDLQQRDNNISAGTIKLRGKTAESYFLLRRKEEIGGKSVYVEIAYRADSEGRIVPITPPPLSVYFPLAKEKPGLFFRLHIPYKTTPDRETCDFDDAENKMLTERAAAFVADTLPILRDKGRLSVQVINDVLPWGTGESHMIYRAIAKTIKGGFLSDKLLPTVCKKYATPKEVIATDKYLPDIIADAGIVGNYRKAEYANRKFWLVKIKLQVQKALGIPSYEINEFLPDAGDELLAKLSDEQMIVVYRRLWSYHREKTQPQKNERRETTLKREMGEKQRMQNYAIVRLQESHGGKIHISAPGVRLPGKGGDDSVFPTVKLCFFKNRTADEFIRNVLQIRAPNDIDEVGEIAKIYKEGKVALGRHAADMRKILQVGSAKKEEVKHAIAETPVVKTAGGMPAFAALGKSFLKCDDLLRVFAGYPGVRFVDESFYDKAFDGAGFSPNGGWRGLLKNLGVRDIFVIGTGRVSMEMLEYALRSIANSEGGGGFGRSIALWRFLIRSVRGHNDYDRGQLSEKFTAFSWLYDKNKVRVPAEYIGEYALEEIHPRYKEEAANADAAALSKTTGLKLDDVKELRRQVRHGTDKLKKANAALAAANEIIAAQNERIAELERKARAGGTNAQSGNGNHGDGSGKKAPPKKIDIVDSPVWQSHERDPDSVGGGKYSEEDRGRIGEAALCEWLRKEYPGAEVVNKNDGGKNNPGYDILVRRDGITEYYECKSFVSATLPLRVRMTRAQMEMAEREEEHYFLCVIYDAGANPVKMLPPICNPAILDKSEAEWSVDITGYKSKPSPD